MKYGAGSVVINEVVKDVSAAKKTIYPYYKDKNEIATSVTQAPVEKKKKEFTNLVNFSQGVIEEMIKTGQYIKKLPRECMEFNFDYKTKFIKDPMTGLD